MVLTPWLMAARPRTLALSLTPVMVGAALAWAMQRDVRTLPVLAALVGSMCIQVGTNLHNDAVDSERGGDGPDRVGPPRVTAQGLLGARAVKLGAILCFALAALTGLFLIFIGGWPILLLGLASILAGWAYTGGPWPIAYTPLGELFVVAFFGLGAVGGTYWLSTGRLGAAPLEAGLALGLLTAAVLLVNNHRDVVADARVGRRTLAIVAGAQGTAWIYAVLMLAPFVLLWPLGEALPHGEVWPALAVLAPALALIYRFTRERPGRGFNRLMVWTVQVQFLFGLLLSVGLLL